MALVDLNSIQFYQPPITTAENPQRRPSAWSDTVPKILQRKDPSERVHSHRPAPIYDLTASPLPNFTERFLPWTPESKDTAYTAGEFVDHSPIGLMIDSI